MLDDGGKPPIRPVAREDLPRILALQKLAFAAEATRYADPQLPPMTQTLPELEAEFARSRFLQIVAGDAVIASVRGYVDAAGTGHVGRLIVAPAEQGRGLGGRLLRAIEAELADAVRFELFTGDRSAGPMKLYERLGYRRYKTVANGTHALVYMEKRPWPPRDE
ncbi:MAG TPA: GNAT family N-acetyltransferase [Polyangia bacterium]|jgi:GNAT superfamily N-acetyltransferase|nr:GNAT family N-acetyltransferase [Polyangia bacterium]